MSKCNPIQDILRLNIPWKFKSSSCNTEGARGVTVKSLHTLRQRRRTRVKTIVSTCSFGGYNYNFKLMLSDIRKTMLTGMPLVQFRNSVCARINIKYWWCIMHFDNCESLYHFFSLLNTPLFTPSYFTYLKVMEITLTLSRHPSHV